MLQPIFSLAHNPIKACKNNISPKKTGASEICISEFNQDRRRCPAGALPSRKVRLLEVIIDRIALILTIIGALNWGSIGLFNFDIVAWICGPMSVVSRIIYTAVALAGVWCISLIFRARETFEAIEEV